MLPPEFILPDFLKEGLVDYTAEYFDPTPMKVPPIELLVPPSILNTHQEDIWYINIVSDSVFDYRAVELPFDLIESIWPPLPSRNLTETEWRSIGVTQSKGWENYHRPFGERNVLLFRRLREGVESGCGKREIINQLEHILNGMDAVLSQQPSFPIPVWISDQVRTGFNFPMIVFDPDMRSAYGLPELDPTHPVYREIVADGSVAFSTTRRMLDFQIKVVEFSINQLKN
jgi:cyclin-dependent kinase regulatory subunit CKS1